MTTLQKSTQTAKTTAFGLKGNLLTLTVMHLFQADLDAIRQQLKSTVASTPKFFINMPIVVDLQHLSQHPYPIDYSAISLLLREFGLIPVGVCNGTPEQLHAANSNGLGTLSQIKKEAKSVSSSPKPETPSTDSSAVKSTKTATATRSKVILTPIRSGQQVYAKGGDLVIINTVSAGAEVLADGNIHIYGTLRGRALAGVQGDTSARIFCHGLQAELISIAGQYKLQDSIEVPNLNTPVQIFLQDDQLHIASF